MLTQYHHVSNDVWLKVRILISKNYAWDEFGYLNENLQSTILNETKHVQFGAYIKPLVEDAN